MKEINVHQTFPDGCFGLRSIAIIIQDDKLLVAKNAKYDCFYTVGGGVHAHEDSASAAIREVFEETGLRMKTDRLLFVNERFFHHDTQEHHEVAFFYLMDYDCCPIPDGATTDCPGETLHWLPIDQLNTYNLVPAFLKESLRKLPDNIVHIVEES